MSLDFMDRLRQGSFISPETTTEQIFQVDSLQKRGGKKYSNLEIVDSDESVTFDRGNLTDRYPMSLYFIGDDFDTQLTDFEKLLKEHYSQDFPGFLRHPLWGDIDIFPTSWTISTELKDGVGVGRIQVEYIEVFPRKYPESDLDNSDIASGDLDDMAETNFAERMVTNTVAAAKNIKGKIEAVVNIISSATEIVEDIENTITDIQSEIDSLIDDVGGNITELLFATQRLIRLPGRVVDSTMNKINTYKDMITDIIGGVSGETGQGGTGSATEETNKDNKKNNAVLMEAFAGYAVGCLAEAAIYTNFDVRTNTIEAIEIINDSIDEYNAAMAAIYPDDDNIENNYSGDHNFQSLLYDVIARVNQLLLDQTFDLKAEKKFILTEKSDALNLCYKYYNAVDEETMQYFIDTNKSVHDEFLEIPAGREIVIYI